MNVILWPVGIYVGIEKYPEQISNLRPQLHLQSIGYAMDSAARARGGLAGLHSLHLHAFYIHRYHTYAFYIRRQSMMVIVYIYTRKERRIHLGTVYEPGRHDGYRDRLISHTIRTPIPPLISPPPIRIHPLAHSAPNIPVSCHPRHRIVME